jgi:sec-independent protein translocase protein TatA
MPSLGGLEIVIVLVIVVLLFGPGRIGRIGSEMGSAIKNFRRGLEDEGEGQEKSAEEINDSTKDRV